MGGRTYPGPRNPFWRGGRSITQAGYVLVRVGKDHHLAAVRGYAYEHRVVAEKKIGRRLLRDEQVHHIDGNRQNNDPANLEVMPSARHHQAKHRTRADLQGPDEPNPLVACGCGCGSYLRRFDASGRPRRFISGHNPREAATVDAIMVCLREACAPRHRDWIAARIAKPIRSTAVALSKMKARQQVAACGRGYWKAVNTQEKDNG
jgi:hypothetical protein